MHTDIVTDMHTRTRAHTHTHARTRNEYLLKKLFMLLDDAICSGLIIITKNSCLLETGCTHFFIFLAKQSFK